MLLSSGRQARRSLQKYTLALASRSNGKHALETSRHRLSKAATVNLPVTLVVLFQLKVECHSRHHAAR